MDRRRVLIQRDKPAAAALDAAAGVAAAWRGRYRHVAVVAADQERGDLGHALAQRMMTPVATVPLSQAAAWAEHRYGAAPGEEFAFIWAGEFIGGAIISSGRLLRGAHGLAGRIGAIRLQGGTVGEAACSGGILRRAGSAARNLEGLLAADRAGAGWAGKLLEEAAAALATAIIAVQAVLDPPLIVLGGPIGAAPGFVERLRGQLAETTPRPTLIASTMGAEGALIGAADHASASATILALTSS